MAMDWPAFHEYNPEAKKTHKPKQKQQQNTADVYRLNKVKPLFSYLSE